jgi:hypothetical protein
LDGLLHRTKRGYSALPYRFDEEAMQMKSTAALCFGLVIFGLATAPADAQNRTRQRSVVSDSQATRYTVVDENGRTRTRIVVQRRSFLDGGTEILPGTQPSTNDVWPFGYNPLGVIERTNFGGLRWPLPGPYDLMGKDNPYPYQ